MTSDWLAQSQEAATRTVATGEHEIVDGGKSGRVFSVIDEFNNWRKQPNLAEAVAVIHVVVAVIRNSEANNNDYNNIYKCKILFFFIYNFN